MKICIDECMNTIVSNCALEQCVVSRAIYYRMKNTDIIMKLIISIVSLRKKKAYNCRKPIYFRILPILVLYIKSTPVHLIVSTAYNIILFSIWSMCYLLPHCKSIYKMSPPCYIRMYDHTTIINSTIVFIRCHYFITFGII